MRQYAKIDKTKKYRYLLGREWDKNGTKVTFIMLNPSTADDKENDPTLNKCIKFAKDWGHGSLELVNLFAYRATKPRDILIQDDPVGPNNNCYIKLSTADADEVIVAWGASRFPKQHCNRDKDVLTLISGKSAYRLGDLTKKGRPRHPLYLPINVGKTVFL